MARRNSLHYPGTAESYGRFYPGTEAPDASPSTPEAAGTPEAAALAQAPSFGHAASGTEGALAQASMARRCADARIRGARADENLAREP